MADAFINLAGLALIALIIWWFWMSKPVAKKYNDSQVVDILVQDGVYTPSRIEVQTNQTVTLRFIREDVSPCAEKVFFSSLDKSLELPLHTPVEIELTLPDAGEYAFTCDMQMYRGSLLVKSAT